MATLDRAASATGHPAPVVPTGQDPRTYRLEEVEEWMRAAYFSLFSVPNPQTPDVPIEAELPFPFSLLQRLPFFPQLLRGVEVNEAPLRFQTTVGQQACQLLATNTVGQPVATVHIRWTPIPWEYPANPFTNPPQTILNPLVSQRFEMLNGEFLFDDHTPQHGTTAQRSGIHGFGSGRTFPVFPRGLSLKIGAVIDILEGFGEFAGHHGLLVVNGLITPPNELDLNIMARLIDPSGKLLATAPLPPLSPQPFPDKNATFMMLLGEPDPSQISPLIRDRQGRVVGIDLRQQLRAIDLDFAVPPEGPRSQVKVGGVVGRARCPLKLPLHHGTPIPAQSSKLEFELFSGSSQGLGFGTVNAELVEGRGFPTRLGDAPNLLYRVGAFGPLSQTTGQFEGLGGLVSMNSLISLYPRTFNNLYIIRFDDPQGRLRPVPGSEQANRGVASS